MIYPFFDYDRELANETSGILTNVHSQEWIDYEKSKENEEDEDA